ncbi:MAG: phosphodiester glycosidase family protein [Acidobacteria bacterium]|nr:phosphodiester glycosidase family protein [Acidobacteriota bacterium]
MRRLLTGIAGLFFICSAGFGQEVLDLYPDQPGSLICWSETRTTPRPLRIYYLKIALNTPDLEVITLAGEDPDGEGPAESQLAQPMNMFRKFQALAAVNANAYSGPSGDLAGLPNWREGHPVNVHGLVVSQKKIVSPIESKRTPFWIDAQRKPHIFEPPSVSLAAEAVSDWFSPLIVDSKIVPDPSDQALHPRTALGFDHTGAWLLFVVVDGRQPGFSEGVSLYELAQVLQSQGCAQSINLDGGGSSIMLIREPGKDVRTVNSPSGKAHRPIPVMLGVRKSARF